MNVIIVNEESNYIDEHVKNRLSNKDYEVIYRNREELVKDEQINAVLLIIDIDTVTLAELYAYVRYAKKQRIATVVCTENPNHIEIPLLFRHELKGYFFKEVDKDVFIQKFKGLTCESSYIDEKIVPALFRDYIRITQHSFERPDELLTDREWEILELIVQGKTTAHMSIELSISTKTVTNHVASILQKLQVDDRINAALMAVKNKWIIL